MKKAKFSRDKATLLKRLEKFDGNVGAENTSTSIKLKKHLPSNHTFLLHVLLEQICKFVEPDDMKRALLFDALRKHLAQFNLIDSSLELKSLISLRQELAENFFQFVKQIHSQILPVRHPIDFSLSPKETEFPTHIHLQNRFEEIFDEVEEIAKGGFGVVCKARHKVDGIIYAVKKIIFKYKNDKEYLKVMREVKHIATLRHQNVVNYNNAWIESLPSENAYNLSHCSEESSSQSSESYSSEENSKNHSHNSSNSKFLDKETELKIKDDDENSLNNDSYSFSNIHNNTDDSLEIFELEEDSNHLNLSSQKNENLDYNTLGSIVESQLNILSNKYFSSNESSASNSIDMTNMPISHLIKRNKHFINNHLHLNKNSKHEKENILHIHEDISSSQSLLPDISPTTWSLDNLNIKIMLCIQMEYCDSDLRHWLDCRAKGEALPFQMEVMHIFKDILCGVAHIHSKSIIHRDLKPQNIFYSRETGVMKIGDFGLARLIDSAENHHKGDLSGNLSADLGTIPYSAPEQRSQRKYDYKVDIYSLGIILIELLNDFQTRMELAKSVEEILKGNPTPYMLANWPNHIELVKCLVKRNPKERLAADEILKLPILKQILKKNEEINWMEYEKKIQEISLLNQELKETSSLKEKEIAHLKETLNLKEKEIAHLKEIIKEQEQKLMQFSTTS